jgi:flagellar motor switch protein FliM
MTDVIRRKVDRARQPHAEGAPGADRAWRLALARAAHETMGLHLDFRRLSVARAGLAEILDLAPDRALIALLDGPGGGLGTLMLAPGVTSALIEMQTLGRLQANPPPPRRPTRIDAAMVSGVIDRALVDLTLTLAEEDDLIWAGGFRYASYLDEVRPLGLMLEEEAYRVLTAEVSLGPGARGGGVVLVLPATGRGEGPSARPDMGAETPTLPFTAALAAQVEQVDCRLDAVIGRLVLPIRHIMAMAPGEVLPIPLAALDAVTLETVDGRRIARARLGQNRGMRALKIMTTDSPARLVPTPRMAETAVVEEPPPALRAAG